MAEVTVKISGRPYRVACDDGQEARVAMLAERIDAEARKLGDGGVTPETQLLLMSALLLADRLEETEAALAARPEPQPFFDEADAREALDDIEAATAKVVALRREDRTNR